MTRAEVLKKIVGTWQLMPVNTESKFDSEEIEFTVNGMYHFNADYALGEGGYAIDTSQQGDKFHNWVTYDNTEYYIEKLTENHLFLVNKTVAGADKRYVRLKDISLN